MDLKFIDISSEQFREYTFPDGSTYTIDKPVKLAVRQSGSHSVIDVYGNNYYIKSNFIAIKWLPYDGQPNFVA
jgi:hypothetical protein